MSSEAIETGEAQTEPGQVQVEFAGEWFAVDPAAPFVIGREGDLAIDDNQYLHRHFLELRFDGRLWWLTNMGSRLAATVSSGEGTVQSWLAPGAGIPLVFADYTIVFTAGPTTYDMHVQLTAPPFQVSPQQRKPMGTETIMPIRLNADQRLLVLALAEPILRRDTLGASQLPSNLAACEQLGWSATKFNRKLDYLCEKFSASGVQGLRGGIGKHAVNRRARLVEYCVSMQLVSRTDLAELDEHVRRVQQEARDNDSN